MKCPPLVRQRRFGPFFVTQALGAFNDNVFKQALVIMITYQGLMLLGMEAQRLVNFAQIVFILPFFIFSATAGQIADRYGKDRLIRIIKLCELGIMLLATAAFFSGQVGWLLLILFLMGSQSAFYGPVKYSILPQILSPHELVKGNGQVSMATFVAILLGSLTGGILIAVADVGWILVCIVIVLVAAGGYAAARWVPPVAPTDPELRIDFNLVRQTWRILGYARENTVVFRSILGYSWFWFFGSVMLAQLPPLIKIHLLGSESVAVLVFALFSVGVGAGSLLCDKLSFRRVEIGLVPLGAIGLSVFAADLYFAVHAIEPATQVSAFGAFMAREGAWRFVIDVVLLGVAGGLYVVPLQALVQHRARPAHRSRVIAGANVMNALFMVLAGIVSITLLSLGFDVVDLVLITALLNAAVAIYIFSLVPEFLLRFITWVLVNTVYRIRVSDLDKVPAEGGALLVCNHVSFVDALVIGGAIRRPVRFVMYHKYFDWPLLGRLFRAAKAIPIAAAREHADKLAQAYERIAEELRAGELVCIFPEGALTRDGEVAEFKRGVEQILSTTPVPVVPMGLSGLWGSIFSRAGGSAKRGWWRGWWHRIRLSVGDSMPAQGIDAALLRDRVLALIDGRPRGQGEEDDVVACD